MNSPICSSAMAEKGLLVRLFEYKAWANRELIEAIATLSEPDTSEERHLSIRILNHTHVVDKIFSAHLLDATHSYSATNTIDTPTLADLSVSVSATDQWYCSYVAKVRGEGLSEQVAFTFTDGDEGRLTRNEILLHVINHGSYHRGAIGRVLAAVGKAPPRDTFTRFLSSFR